MLTKPPSQPSSATHAAATPPLPIAAPRRGGASGERLRLEPDNLVVELNATRLLDSAALITDGRFSGGSWGWIVGHVAPEAFVDGTIARVKNGDSITLDRDKRLIQLNVSAMELAARRKKWKAPKPRYKDGILAEYARDVPSASIGAVTN